MHQVEFKAGIGTHLARTECSSDGTISGPDFANGRLDVFLIAKRPRSSAASSDDSAMMSLSELFFISAEGQSTGPKTAKPDLTPILPRQTRARAHPAHPLR